MFTVPSRLFSVIIIAGFLTTTVFSQVKKTVTKTVNKTTTVKKPLTSANTIKPKPTTVAKIPAKKIVANKTAATVKTKPAPITSTSKTDKQIVPVAIKPAAPVVVVPAPTTREQQMINEINMLRTNPAEYCSYIDNYLERNDADPNVRNIAKEVKNILKKMKPLNQLILNTDMYRDARNFGLTLVKNNELEHSDLPYAENISLGYENVRDAIIDLLIDDDVPDRGHRKNLLSDKITTVAVAEIPGKIQDIAYCYVQVFK